MPIKVPNTLPEVELKLGPVIQKEWHVAVGVQDRAPLLRLYLHIQRRVLGCMSYSSEGGPAHLINNSLDKWGSPALEKESDLAKVAEEMEPRFGPGPMGSGFLVWIIPLPRLFPADMSLQAVSQKGASYAQFI